MSSTPRHQTLLITVFLAMIFGVPFGQVLIEVGQGQTPFALELFRRKPTVENLRKFENDLEQRSWFERKLRPWMQYARFLVLRETGAKAVVGNRGWWYYRPGVRYLVEPPPAPSDYQHTVDVIANFRDQLAARDIALLVVPVPGKATVYPEYLVRGAEHPDTPEESPTLRLIRDLKEADVHVVDLNTFFQQARRHNDAQSQWLYLPRDTHWTPYGAERAAEHVASRIIELGLTSKGSVDYAAEPATVDRLGDVIKMLRCPPIEQRFEPAQVTCRQVIRQETGELYQDDLESPILVLGDSFLRIYQKDAPKHAGFIAHLARAMRRPLDSIVDDGGASTLVREKLAHDPERLIGKALVVWEFVERDIGAGRDGWKEVTLPAEMSQP